MPSVVVLHLRCISDVILPVLDFLPQVGCSPPPPAEEDPGGREQATRGTECRSQEEDAGRRMLRRTPNEDAGPPPSAPTMVRKLGRTLRGQCRPQEDSEDDAGSLSSACRGILSRWRTLRRMLLQQMRHIHINLRCAVSPWHLVSNIQSV